MPTCDTLSRGPNVLPRVAAVVRVGPSYYAAALKNAALSALPEEWDSRKRGFDHPSASVRLGWRPAVSWTLGASAGSGPYLREKAARTLAPDQDLGDFRETVIGADASYARHHLPLWGEFFAGRFDVATPTLSRLRPSVADA